MRTDLKDAPRWPMKSIADQLPPEIAQQLHPDRRKNEAAYWAVRDQLLDQYQGQWIGFADGRVIASGTSPVTVFHAAEATGLHPLFISVEFRQASGSRGWFWIGSFPIRERMRVSCRGRIVSSFS